MDAEPQKSMFFWTANPKKVCLFGRLAASIAVVNDGRIAQILRSRNVWWRDPNGWVTDDVALREAADAPFDYRPDPLDGIEPPGLYVLRGPRRVGKSVELKRAIVRLIEQGVDPRSIVYCACNGFGAQDLRRVFAVGRNLVPADGPLHWVLDEVTAVGADWSAVVKDARDDTPLAHDCVIVTGSSARELRDAEKNLAGRRGGVARSNRLLMPMGFPAFCAAIGAETPEDDGKPLRPRDLLRPTGREQIAEAGLWTESLGDAWELYLDVGGFPRAVRGLREQGDASEDFVNDLWAIVKDDAIRQRMGETEAMVLLARLVDNLASPINASKLANDTGIDNHHRVNDRIGDLVATFLAWRCYQDRDGLPNTNAQRKVYFVDPLVARLPQRRNPAFDSVDNSRLSEQQIGLALAMAMESERPGSFVDGSDVLYARTPSKTEIDFVGPRLEVAVESKYVDANWKREAQTVAARYGRGVVATRRVLNLDGSVWAVPAGLLAWLVTPRP